MNLYIYIYLFIFFKCLYFFHSVIWPVCLALRFLCQAAATANWETTAGLQQNKINVVVRYCCLCFTGSGSSYIFGQKHAGETDPFSKVVASLINPFPRVCTSGSTLFSKVCSVFMAPFFKGFANPFSKVKCWSS